MAKTKDKRYGVVEAKFMHVNDIVADMVFEGGRLIQYTPRTNNIWLDPFITLRYLEVIESHLFDRKLSSLRKNRASYFKTNPRNLYEELIETHGYKHEDSCWVRFDGLGERELSYESLFK